MKRLTGKRAAAALATALFVASLAPASAVAAPGYRGYADVDSEDWYVKMGTFDYALDHKLMKGYEGSNDFGPNDVPTRAQVVMVLWRTAGEPAASSQDFADVNYGDWYGSAVRWARQAGVVTGYENGSNNFGPNDPITREQLVTMFYRYARDVAKVDTSASTDGVSKVAGWDQVSDWARDPFAGRTRTRLSAA